MEDVWSHVLILFTYCRRGKNHFDVHFRRTRPVYSLSKDEDDAAFAEENGGKKFIFRRSRHFRFVDKNN